MVLQHIAIRFLSWKIMRTSSSGYRTFCTMTATLSRLPAPSPVRSTRSSAHFNAILLDLGLPDGDGLDVLKETQRMDPTLPVVIVTAHISHDRTVGSLKEGAFAYMTKPYHREELGKHSVALSGSRNSP